MDRSAAKAIPTDELLFRDGLGDRFLVRDTQDRPLHEMLVLRDELTAVPSFEFALNQRLTQLDKFEHGSFVQTRQLLRLPGGVPRLSLVSDYLSGTRLSDMLATCDASYRTLSTGAALFLIREILDAVAALHRQNPDVSHGALSPERILLADGKVRIADYVLGSAIEQLRYSPERYWKELRVTVPPAAGGLRFDRRVDVAQVGMIAVALLASRPLHDAEGIGGLAEVMMGLTQQTGGAQKSLSLPLRGWLLKALHMDLRRTFATAVEAEHALEEAMAEAGVQATSTDLELVGMKPRRVATPIMVKTAAPKAVAAVAPPRPVTGTMAPVNTGTMAPLNKDVWDAPDADPRTQLRRGRIIASATKPRGVMALFKLGVLAVVVAGAFTAAQYIPPPAKLFSSTGTLVVESKPEGVQLLVDGESQGVTPMTLKLKAGRHEVELRGSGKPRVFNVYVTKGDRVSQYIELPVTRARK